MSYQEASPPEAKAQRRPSKFTPERIQQIKDLLTRGESCEQIAASIGVTVGTLKVTCSRLGISLRRPRVKLLPLRTAHSIARTVSAADETATFAISMKYKGQERHTALSLTPNMINQLALEALFRDQEIGELAKNLLASVIEKGLFKELLGEWLKDFRALWIRLDEVVWRLLAFFPVSSGQCEPHATDRSISSIGALLPIAMWGRFVVVSTPSLALSSRIVDAYEQMCIQTFRSEFAIERLDEGVAIGLARSAEVDRDTALISPEVEIAGNKLCALIDPDCFRESEEVVGADPPHHAARMEPIAPP